MSWSLTVTNSPPATMEGQHRAEGHGRGSNPQCLQLSCTCDCTSLDFTAESFRCWHREGATLCGCLGGQGGHVSTSVHRLTKGDLGCGGLLPSFKQWVLGSTSYAVTTLDFPRCYSISDSPPVCHAGLCLALGSCFLPSFSGTFHKGTFLLLPGCLLTH